MFRTFFPGKTGSYKVYKTHTVVTHSSAIAGFTVLDVPTVYILECYLSYVYVTNFKDHIVNHILFHTAHTSLSLLMNHCCSPTNDPDAQNLQIL